jgi:hypothetical protein
MGLLGYQYMQSTLYFPPSTAHRSDYGRNGMPLLESSVTGQYGPTQPDRVFHLRLSSVGNGFVSGIYTYYYAYVSGYVDCSMS